eukprot:CCRYP_020396-RB/>CCRYP_020396-RB protein AED:0.08 eAED:0.08 QI:181/1/1/1/0.5/0.33/3/1779/326
MPLAVGQWFAILPKIGGFISIIASSLVIRDIFSGTKSRHAIPVTTAITLGKSVSCCLFSFFGPLMSTWMAPRGDAFYALGNRTTCEIQGFIVTFAIVSFVAYFVAFVAIHGLKSRHILTESELNSKNIKRLALLLPVALASVAAIVPLLNSSYNFSGIYSCSIAPFPLGCGGKSGITCTRGAHARATVGWITFSFNTVAYCFAFLGYYTGDKPIHYRLFDTWPTIMRNFTICFSCLVGSVLVLKYGTVEAKLFTFYLNVTITPLVGLFMSLIYFFPLRNANRGNDEKDHDSISMGLSEPFINKIEKYARDEESPSHLRGQDIVVQD